MQAYGCGCSQVTRLKQLWTSHTHVGCSRKVWKLCTWLGATDVADALRKLAAAKKSASENGPCGLVIDGQTLQWILEAEQGKAIGMLYELGILSISCVCARFSPGQKRRIVDEVRKQGHSTTLAIGDGANDVPMILGAHVGIGIRGEGRLSSRSSQWHRDFAAMSSELRQHGT